jgi:hypothetical protein
MSRRQQPTVAGMYADVCERERERESLTLYERERESNKAMIPRGSFWNKAMIPRGSRDIQDSTVSRLWTEE